MPYRDNLSYLVPRDPSIRCWDDRVKVPGPCAKTLFQLGTDEYEETMGDKIRVYLRLKPSVSVDNPYTVLSSTMLQSEAPKDSVSYKNVTNGVGKLIHKFTFTSVLDQDTTQAELFRKCAVKNLKTFLSGENYLLMAYGTTSAGKTYTMQGNVDHPGVIPRALDFLFTALKDRIIPNCRYSPYQYNEFMEVSEEQAAKDLIHKNFILSLDLTKYQRYPDVTYMTIQTSSSSSLPDSYENVTFKEMQSNLTDMESFEVTPDAHQYSVWVSMVEIYNEQVYDLLDIGNEKGQKPKLPFREDEYGNTFVKNLRYVNVSSGHEAFQILQFGRSNLHFAPTALNTWSSRSHCIFTVTLAKFVDYNTSSHAIMSRFSFCDLAGMERAKKTLNVKDRLVESKAINTSLSILVKCLTTIKENQCSREKKMIPYRESKLTKLFRDAVTGKERFSLIVNVTTEPNLFDETLNVLKFSAIAQKIVPQNVFARPKAANVKKRSRFSRIVSASSNTRFIDWDASMQPQAVVVKEEPVPVAELQDLVENLREELAREKKRSEEIEAEVREELTGKFWEMLKKQNESNRIRMENETEKIHEMYEKKERRLAKYYEMLRNKKRPKLDDDLSDYEDIENRLRETERDVEVLRTESESLKTQMQELLGEKNRLTSECSELKFRLVEKDREVEAMKRMNDAKEAGSDELEKELQKQLNEANAKISNFKSLLAEAASDCEELEGNNKFLRNENKVLEQHLTEQLEMVNGLKNENAELHNMLSHKRIMLEKLEQLNEKMREESETERREEGTKPEEANICQRELELLREQLKKTSEWLGRSRDECEEVKAEKLDLEKDLEIARLKVADLQSKLSGLEESSCREAELERRSEELEKEKEVLEGRCKELEAEVKSLQKEVKDLLGASKESERLELEALTKENESYQKEVLRLKFRNSELEEEMKRLSENLKSAERESKMALDSLRAKVEVVEQQNSVLKALKDEADRKAYEVPQLQEEIKRLETEIDNRERDMKAFDENRKAIFKNYENELMRLNEENDRLRKDVLFAKNLAPVETDKAEITPPRESVKKKDEGRLKEEVESFKKPEPESVKKTRETDRGNRKQGLEEVMSSRENTPYAKKTREGENGLDKLMTQVADLSIQKSETRSTRKKVDLLDETIHPSTIKKTNKGRKKKEKKETETTIENEKENIPTKKKGKCYKKLFTDNDFDELIDLNTSPLEEMSRLRPRK